jgi:hypothetical protein
MTAMRLISLPVHAALEMLVGLVLMAAPVALSLSPAAAVVGVVAGAVIVGIALSTTDAEIDGRRPMSVATHHGLDYGLATGLLGTAAVVGFAGDRHAAALFGVIALAQLALNLTTRYSRR